MGVSVQIDGGGKDFEPVTEMIQNAVLADIVDKGMVPNKFKPGSEQHKCYFVWIVEELDEEGRNKRVFESFTVSLNDKATLRKRLKDFGFGEKEVEELKKAKQSLDLDKYIGIQRKLVLSAEDSDKPGGKPFIKVNATMAVKKGEAAPTVPSDFIRKQDRAD